MHRWPLLLAAIGLQLLAVNGQADYYCGPPIVNKTIDSCPRGWYRFGSTCYYFNQYPVRTRDKAQEDCQKRAGHLLRIDTTNQFEFVTKWLDSHAYNKKLPLHTSGRIDGANRFRFYWEFHTTNVEWRTEIQGYWLEETPRQGDGRPPEYWRGRDIVQLGSNGARWGWYFRNNTGELPYICQADAETVTAALPKERDFEYGVKNISQVTRSPCMQQQPKDLVYFENTRSGGGLSRTTAIFECVAYANPLPTYNWYNFDTSMNATKIDPLTRPRFSVTNGKLTIHDVSSKDDSGRYACEAVNAHGAVMSRHAKLSFGNLPTFPKASQETITKRTFDFANIECKLSDSARPRDLFNFQFYYKTSKDTRDIREIRPEFRPNLFVSQATGRLYFSEVQSNDHGFYYCQVGVTVGVSTQEKGPDVQLIVQGGSADKTSVTVADGFPANVPKAPLRGDDVRLECVGYGPVNSKSAMVYYWRRTNGLSIPSRVRYVDSLKRAFVIPNAQVEDSGGYQCQVEDGERRLSAWRLLQLTINSGPFLITYPFDQFVDEGAPSVRFTCKATGTPPLTYEWFRGQRNGRTEKLDSIADLDRTRFSWDTTSNLPFLEIKDVVSADVASYGCRVSNSYDTIYGFAELKVLNLPPSFFKNPSTFASGLVGNTVYLPCDVEAAPEPQRQWQRDDASLSVTRAEDQPDGLCPPAARLCEMRSGSLRILALSGADAGLYRCVASNRYGSANSTVQLSVVNSLSLSISPMNRIAIINSTISLPCQLGVLARNLDVNYAWRFESTDILFGRFDFDARRYEATQFYRPYRKDFGTLRIANIQYDYEGNYTCVAQTPLGSVEASAYIRVAGPPGPCAGVQIPVVNSTEFTVMWRSGRPHHGQVSGYLFELELAVDPGRWRPHVTLSEAQVNKINDPSEIWGETTLRSASISDLPFYQRYRLRVSAINEYGVGIPSPPSQFFTTVSGPPSRVPQNVTGGGGKVKTLVVRWRMIDPAHQGGANFTYDIEYRLERDADSTWSISKGRDGLPVHGTPYHFEAAIMLSGADTYYKRYRVRVRGVSFKEEIINGRNTLTRMPGSWSEEVVIYSAEIVPVSAPSGISAFAFNSTAVQVEWQAPPDYDGVQGNILGYRIVYWPKLSTCSVENNADKVMNALRLTMFGKETAGMVIGLEPDTFYCFSVQMFNSAGDSPESPWRDVTTNKRAPSDFPTNVVVHSTGEFSTVRVTWYGIRQQPGEESVDGYIARYWITGAPATNFTETDAGMSNEVLVRKLSTDVRYDLRVYGYSAGGIGTFSSPMIQFMIIPKDRCVPGASWEAPDIKYVFVCSACRPAGTSLLAAAAVLLALGLGRLQ